MIDSIYLWFGLGGISLAGLGAVAYFFPPLRKLAIQIGLAILAVMAIYGKGVRDATRKSKIEQEAERQKAIKAGNAARDAAMRDVADGVSDGFDRHH